MKLKLILFATLSLAVLSFTVCSDPDAEVCGNGVLDFPESCDGHDVGGWTCKDLPALGRYAGGFLGCNNDCTLDTSSCDPCWGYPCTPEEGYGRAAGSIIEDTAFIAANDAAKDYGVRNETPEEFMFNHIYKEGISKGGPWKGALIFVTTGWCPYCRAEADLLEERYQYYKSKGILFIAVVTQDSSGVTASAEYANVHASSYDWTFPTVAGEFPIKYWPDQVGYPLNITIDINNMEIINAQAGALMTGREIDFFLVNLLSKYKE